MVDINLFSEDDADEEKNEEQQNNDADDIGDLLGDELSNDFGGDLDDDKQIESKESVDDFGDDILGSDDIEDGIPEFTDMDEETDKGDYSSSSRVKKKGAPILLWITLAIVVFAAGFYYLVIIPKQKEIAQNKTKVPKNSPEVQKLIEQMRQKKLKASESQQDSAKGVKAANTNANLTQQGSKQISSSTVSGNNKPVESSNSDSYSYIVDKCVNVLVNSEKLGTFLIFENGFALEYNSKTQNSAKELASKIETIIGVKNLKISPEDVHKTGGQIRYSGVISGKLSANSNSNAFSEIPAYTTKSLNEKIKSTAASFNLSVKNVEVFNARYKKSIKTVPLRVKLEGQGRNVMDFMKTLCSAGGNYIVTKIMIAPVKLTDFKGDNLKMVLDLELSMGNISQ